MHRTANGGFEIQDGISCAITANHAACRKVNGHASIR